MPISVISGASLSCAHGCGSSSPACFSIISGRRLSFSRMAKQRRFLFQMIPSFALWPMVLLATVATVIASQAVITGAYSVARQAVQLNILPRLEIQHTSGEIARQIYIPRVNLLLGLAVVILVLGFEKSSNLAAAYGIAVTGNMLVTTVLLYIVMTRIRTGA